jgi:shikimate dehydrogenase
MNMFGTNKNVKAAVVGHPTAQSLSPAMHNAVFQHQNLHSTYVAVDVTAENFAEMLNDARTFGLRGLSVTMPHKEIAFASMDKCDDRALDAQSVNTVVFEDNGQMFGTNTDGDGACAALKDCGAVLQGARCVILGAGATARSIIRSLARSGAVDIAVVNRSPENARSAATLVGQARIGSFDDVASASVLINATSVGMGSNESPILPSCLHAGLTVLDVVYFPLETTFLREARQAGATAVDGLEMLVQQAALQQLAWFGKMPDVEVMRNAALEELRRRSHLGGNK